MCSRTVFVAKYITEIKESNNICIKSELIFKGLYIIMFDNGSDNGPIKTNVVEVGLQ